MQIYAIAGWRSDVDTALNPPILYGKGDEPIRKGYPFFPYDSEDYLAFPSLALRIGRLGRDVSPRFVHRYVENVGLGFDLIAKNALKERIASGKPWEEATAFHECCSAEFPDTHLDEFPNFYTLRYFRSTSSGSLFFTIPEDFIRWAVSFFSRFRKIRQGDILLLHPSTPIRFSISDSLSVIRDEILFVETDNFSHSLSIK